MFPTGWLAPRKAGSCAWLSWEFGFNLSRSAELGVLTLGGNRNIGVDVERIRPDVECEEIARSFFSPGAFQSLMGVSSDRRREGFFLCWTRKEAVLKAVGGGLNLPLDSFDASVEPTMLARFLRGVDSHWRIHSFFADPDYPAALVYDGPQANVHFFSVKSHSGHVNEFPQLRHLWFGVSEHTPHSAILIFCRCAADARDAH
jgi:phosphopantetheinyl transferase